MSAGGLSDLLLAAPRKPDSVGVLAGPEIAIRDDNGAPLGPNSSGHVLVRGPNITPGYCYKDAAATAAAFTNGWFRTGDCGYLDDDGFLFLTGRVSEFINRGGEKVAPSEIDDVFHGHPDVAQAVTFATYDERLGEEVATAIVPRHAGAVTVGQLTRFAATRLAFHKIPRRIYLVSEIPAGRTGKASRTALRALFEAASLQQPDEQQVPRVEPRTDLEKKIAAVWADVLRTPNPGIHDSFFDSGGDSLAAASFFTGLAEVTGTEELTLGVLIEAPSIAELAILLSKPGSETHPSILPLKPAGSAAPLFWIGGFAASSVIKALDRDRPVFLVSLPDPQKPDAACLIDQYAEECCRTLRRFRPHGPYLLAGWCAAGVVALEVARRLEDEREAVGLVLFDARGVLRPRGGFVESLRVSGVGVAQKLLYHLEKLPAMGASNSAGYVAARMKTLWGRFRRGMLCSWSETPSLPDSQPLFSIALRHYQPKPYMGRIVHIWAADRPKGKFRGLESEWGSVGKGPMELYEAPGTHVTMFQNENGGALGQILNGCSEPDRAGHSMGWIDRDRATFHSGSPVRWPVRRFQTGDPTLREQFEIRLVAIRQKGSDRYSASWRRSNSSPSGPSGGRAALAEPVHRRPKHRIAAIFRHLLGAIVGGSAATVAKQAQTNSRDARNLAALSSSRESPWWT